jgi:serine/threonine protein kinase/tetratricopeptide (TPR) repeat protein
MAEVWRAEHAASSVSVALKVVTASRAKEPRYRAAFRNEVQAVARLNHPGIVLVLDHGEVSEEAEKLSQGQVTAGSPYFAMELASWGSLDRVKTRLPFSELQRILSALLDALAHAHARGVIHRDLKPGNVLLAAPTDVRPGLKLTDFGIAHALEADQVGADSAGSGTPHFMAPEQFMGQWRDYGPWTDLYAVGCLAHVLASGGLPFLGESAVQLAYAHLNLEPPKIDGDPSLPPGFGAWVNRLMQKNPGDRFQRAADASWALMELTRDITRPMPIPDPIDTEPESPFDEPQAGGSAGRPRLDSLPLEHAPGRITEVERLPNEAPTLIPRMRSIPGERLVMDEMPTDMVDTGELATLVNATLVGATLPWFSEGRSRPSFDSLPRSALPGTLALRTIPPLPRSWKKPGEQPMQLIGAGLGLYGLRTIPMVDRDAERDAVWRAIREVRETRTPRAIVIDGAAGVGKSRLVEWMTERADEVGTAIVMKAIHSPIPGPSDGLPRMVARHLRVIDVTRDEALARIEEILRAQGVTDDYEWHALTELVQPAIGPERTVQFGSAIERHVLIIRFLERVARERPVIVWLDDVQWGSDSIAFAKRLIRTAAAPILTLLTLREEAIEERALERSGLSELLAEIGVRPLHLPGLAWEDQKRLVNELLVLDDELAREVADRTDGNPLFAVQLVGDWVQRGVLDVAESGFVLQRSERAELPDDIHQVWRRRINRVIAGRSDHAEVALELAAILGVNVDQAEWEYACDEARIERVYELLEVLISSRLANPTESGWAFAHGMLRESLVRSAREKGRYEEHHRTCARMLQRRYGLEVRGIPDRLGDHLVEAGDLEDSFEPLLLGALERLETSQYREAQEVIARREQVLARLGAKEDDERWGEDWVLLARVATMQGRFDEAHTWAEKAERHARRWGWGAVLPEALEVMGTIAYERGDQEGAISAFTKARELYDWNKDMMGVADCLFGMGESVYKLGLFDQAEQYHLEGLNLAETDNNVRSMAKHLLGIGFVRLWRGDLDGARASFRRELALLEGLGNRFRIAQCVSALGEAARQAGDLEQAERQYRRALTIDEAIGSNRVWLDRLNVALVLLARGQYAEAREMIEEVRHRLGEAAEPARRVLVHTELLPCLAETRDWNAWDDHFYRAAELLRETRLKDGDVAWLLVLAGQRALAAGDPVRARHCYELGIQQWLALGRSDKAAEVEDAIGRLRAGSLS